MSPAAQRLLSYKLNLKSSSGVGTPSPLSGKVQIKTPSPNVRSSPYSTPGSSSVGLKLLSTGIRSNLKRSAPPANNAATSGPSSSTSSDSLTDNLLKLPKTS